VVFDRDVGSLFTEFEARDNLVKMTIAAETVTVREKLHWMGTEVEINARRLRFEDVEVCGYDPDPHIPAPIAV